MCEVSGRCAYVCGDDDVCVCGDDDVCVCMLYVVIMMRVCA